MEKIELNWSDFKTNIDNRNLNIQYFEKGNQYYLYAFDGNLTLFCKLEKDDASDFDTNYKSNSNSQLKDRDQTGREIVRTAATVKGWHYQAHSVQFEVNKLNSIYNKDVDGNDLGFSNIKVYKANGDECTTQIDADSNGVKSVVQWKPTFDFEVISGNIRQASKETIDSYIYVQAKVPTGYPAPNDYLSIPFTQGGINLKYIGADEPLKTDGRASKLITGSTGSYFEIVANYSAGLLSGNYHEMSIIFEIYKNPV